MTSEQRNETALKLPERLRPPCPRGCVDVEGCGCDWNVEREAWPNGSALPLELTPGSHVCWVDEDPDDGTPAHYRPCPADLCQAALLHNLICELKQELLARRACLEGARDDLARIANAGVQDGGVWIRAVAEARVPLVTSAIEETDKAIKAIGDFNLHV